MDVQELLDTAKTSQGLTTDKALAAALGVTKQAVSNWRKAVSLPDPVTCATLAGLTGIPLARVLGIVGEARAISREEKAVWRKLAASVGVFLMALSLSIEADAADYVTRHDSGPTLHYAKLWIPTSDRAAAAPSLRRRPTATADVLPAVRQPAERTATCTCICCIVRPGGDRPWISRQPLRLPGWL